ncbi:MAG: hypothetical protein QF464_21405 [Myxococcota bacterium]|nr:hypothetical protein [Myxococcota bacterium]
MNPFRIGFIALAVAAAMYITNHAWRPVFTLRLSQSFELPLWILCAVFGLLQFYLWYATRSRLSLSDEEVSQWGAKLEVATPAILEQAKASKPVKAIAEMVEEDYGIPVDVTLRYIIALGHVTEDA